MNRTDLNNIELDRSHSTSEQVEQIANLIFQNAISTPTATEIFNQVRSHNELEKHLDPYDRDYHFHYQALALINALSNQIENYRNKITRDMAGKEVDFNSK